VNERRLNAIMQPRQIEARSPVKIGMARKRDGHAIGRRLGLVGTNDTLVRFYSVVHGSK
jgi:hypothetical protein